jgi:hypothetical protein
VALAQGDLARAAALLEQAIALCRNLDYRSGLAWSLQHLDTAAAMSGRPKRAACLWGLAETLHEPAAKTMQIIEQACYERVRATVHAQLGEAAFVTALAARGTLTLERAIAYALETEDPSSGSGHVC